MKKPTIIYVVQTIVITGGAACGIGLAGKSRAESLIKSKKYNFKILFTDQNDDLEQYIKNFKPAAVIYNFHSNTTRWVKDETLRKKYEGNIKFIMLHVDMHQKLVDKYIPKDYHGFKYAIVDDDTLVGNEYVYPVVRLMPPGKLKKYSNTGLPIISFQGFGPRHKGIHKLAKQVQDEFDQAILRLHIPYSFYGDPNGENAKKRAHEVIDIIKKPGIKIELSHNLMSSEEVVEFLSESTINCYFYDYLDGAGLASATDYAIAAKRPIAITKSHQFRHLTNLEPSICIEDHSLSEIISFGISPLKELHKKYSEQSFIKSYENALDKILSN